MAQAEIDTSLVGANLSHRRLKDSLGRIGCRRPIKRGVGAGRSAQRGTSGATTGPRGARSAPPNPERDLARSAPPNPERDLARSAPPNPYFHRLAAGVAVFDPNRKILRVALGNKLNARALLRGRNVVSELAVQAP